MVSGGCVVSCARRSFLRFVVVSFCSTPSEALSQQSSKVGTGITRAKHFRPTTPAAACPRLSWRSHEVVAGACWENLKPLKQQQSPLSTSTPLQQREDVGPFARADDHEAAVAEEVDGAAGEVVL